jgi:ferric-dicitrate binding protein FerR (iron transport regulator)
MAYDDEPATQTTLVSGSVRLANGPQLTLLQPGKMALVATAHPQQPAQVITADVEQVTAWKNGKISLANADLAAVMRQLSRWYDINVHYAGAVPDKHFFGSINRNVYLASILAFLKNNGIHVTQEGRNITILP